MLSVLIPTYDYTIYPLVKRIHELLVKESMDFEIICLDDASTNDVIKTENQFINQLVNASFEVLPVNIGRSAIRNLLGKKAKYDWLLFLDADVFPTDDFLLKKYLPFLEETPCVVYGGIKYVEKKPSTDQLLRWKYGIEREALSFFNRQQKPYLSFLTLNFLIHKTILIEIPFNENIPNLRHEDTLFSYNLKEKHITIHHIDNTVYHNGLESSRVFLEKSIDSLKASLYLIQHQLLPYDYIKLNHWDSKIKRYKLTFLIRFFAFLFDNKIKQNLLSDNPSLFLFDVYRLCKINQLH